MATGGENNNHGNTKGAAGDSGCNVKLTGRRAYNLENKDVMLCDVCMELYDEGPRQPKFLSCHHSYCRACLTQVAGERDNIECPACRQVTKLPPGGIPALQTNFYISRLQDSLKQVGAERGKGCRKHSDQPLSFFCKKCSTMICRDCTVLDHKLEEGHVIQDMATADPEQRELFKKQVAVAKETFEEMQTYLGYLEAETQSLSATRESTKKDINVAFEKYVKVLEVRKLQLLKQITDRYNEQQGAVIQRAEMIGSSLQNVAKILAKATHLLGQGQLSELVQTKNILGRNVNHLQRISTGFYVTTGNLLYDGEHGQAEFKSSVAQLGRVYPNNSQPAKAVLDIPELTAGWSATIKLQILSSDDQPLTRDKIDVVINDPERDKLDKILHWDEDDPKQGSINFTAQVSGSLDLIVTYKGFTIPGSETKLLVKSNNPVNRYGELGAGEGQFQSPRAIVVDNCNHIYVADTGNKVIQKLDTEGNFLYQFEIGAGVKNNSTCDLALCDNENLVVCTETIVGSVNNPTSGNTIVIYTKEGELKHKFNNKSMKCALCVTTNNHNEIIVSDFLKHSLYMYDIDGNFLRKIGHPDTFNHPAFICVTEDDRIIVSDTNMDTVMIFDREGNFLHQFGSSGSKKGQLKQPFGVASDGEHILVVDSGNRRIQVFSMDGAFVSAIESLDDPLDQPRGIALTGDGHVYVADRDNHCIKKYRYK